MERAPHTKNKIYIFIFARYDAINAFSSWLSSLSFCRFIFIGFCVELKRIQKIICLLVIARLVGRGGRTEKCAFDNDERWMTFTQTERKRLGDRCRWGCDYGRSETGTHNEILMYVCLRFLSKLVLGKGIYRKKTDYLDIDTTVFRSFEKESDCVWDLIGLRVKILISLFSHVLFHFHSFLPKVVVYVISFWE